MLLMQVPLERRMWLLMTPTLPAALQPLTGWQPFSAVMVSTQVVHRGARASDVDDNHFSGLEGRANSVSPSSYLHTLPDDDDDVTAILSPRNAALGGSSGGEDFDGADRGVTHARLHVDTQSDDDDDSPADTIEDSLALQVSART